VQITGDIVLPLAESWKVGMLESKGRICFAQLCIDWVRHALAAPGLRLLPLTPEIARLPGQIQGDPADRILAATTHILNGTLITQARLLLDYGKQSYLSVIQG
jgi:PIN domain nuclease of toxin-antitoxin system